MNRRWPEQTAPTRADASSSKPVARRVERLAQIQGFTTVMTYLAFRGLEDYRFIGVAWLAHTCWDFAHFLYGNPIVPFVATSSFGCAICDPVIALWCFAGGPSVFEVLRRCVGSGKLI